MSASSSSPGRLGIVISRDGQRIGTYALEQEVVKVGKLSSSHLTLDAPSVSRMHAVIERQDAGWRIIDLGSTEGTFVGGKKIDTAPLGPGSVVQIGPFQLEVIPAEQLGPAPPPPQAAPAPQAAPPPMRVIPCPSCGSTRPAVVTELHTQLSAPELAFDNDAGLTRLRGEICRDCGHLGLFVENPESLLPR